MNSLEAVKGFEGRTGRTQATPSPPPLHHCLSLPCPPPLPPISFFLPVLLHGLGGKMVMRVSQLTQVDQSPDEVCCSGLRSCLTMWSPGPSTRA